MGFSVLVAAVGPGSGPRALLDKLPKQPPWSRNPCPSHEPARSRRPFTRWGYLPFRMAHLTQLAGRTRVVDQFVCFSLFWFVWFLKLSLQLGSSIRTECRRVCGPSSLATLLCAGGGGCTGCVHLSPPPSGLAQPSGPEGLAVCSTGHSRGAEVRVLKSMVPSGGPFCQPSPLCCLPLSPCPLGIASLPCWGPVPHHP